MIIVSRAMDMYNYILGWNNYNKPLYPFSHNLFIFHIFTCDHFRFLSLGKSKNYWYVLMCILPTFLHIFLTTRLP